MNRDLIDAIKQIEREKQIESEKLFLAFEEALTAAYHRMPAAQTYAKADIDRETGAISVFAVEIDPEDEFERKLEAMETLEAEARERGETMYGVDEETGKKIVPDVDAFDLQLDWDEVDPDGILDVTPPDFGRIASMTAKQVFLQKIREEERRMQYVEYIDRVGEVVNGIIQQSERRNLLVDLGRVEAWLPVEEQVPSERYDHGTRLKAVIKEVREDAKRPQVVLSRRSPELVRGLFKVEVPEIADGLVVIQRVAREPGFRSKIAVISKADGVDPVGACVGPRGSRVRMVVSELRGEKIDIIPFNDEPARFVAKALAPARVKEVYVYDEDRQAIVVVPEEQLAVAIGREGQNAKLAGRLTGWHIEIKSEAEWRQMENVLREAGDSADAGGGEFSGRCMALDARGKRCVNAALPTSYYCGLPAHQAMAATPAPVEAAAEPAGEPA